MTFTKMILAAAAAATLGAMPALAQDAAFQLPEQCKPAMDHSAMSDDTMGSGMMGMESMDMTAMPTHVQENMAKMMVTMPAMHVGMMLEDPDVAFACGMIAHHQGAIDMANVLLAHGKTPEMRALATDIIAAQVGEIAQMTKWLAENAM